MTRAQKLGIVEFPYIELEDTRLVYIELENGLYSEYKHNSLGQVIYYKNYEGDGYIEEFDSWGNSIFYMNLKKWNLIQKRNEIIEKILN